MRWISAAALAMTVLVVGPGRIELSAASSLPPLVRASQASGIGPTDASARRVHRSSHRHSRDSDRSPRYFARPYDYEPYPYAPLPFVLFGFGPLW